jgi:predicted dehydrogenase
MSKIGAGVIGTGFIGPAHIEALRRLGMVDVLAIADIDEQTAQAKAQELGIDTAYGDYRELLENNDVEIVHVCSPNYLHHPMTMAALDAGKHVICEKPLAVTINEAEELVQSASAKKLINVVHFNIRYYPLMRHVKNMIEQGELGDVFAVQGSYLQDWLFYPTDYNWRLEPDQSGDSRAIADIGSHWMDLVEYITGLRIARVNADFATFHPIRKKPLKPVETYAGKVLQPEDYADVPINTEDYASVLLRFNNDARGVLTVNQVAAGRKNRLSFEIQGSKCAVAWDSELPNQLWIGRRDAANAMLLRDPSLVSDGSRDLISFPGGHNEGFPDTSKQMFKEVYGAVTGNTQPSPPAYPTFQDGLRELVLCDSILDSSKKEAWVDVIT